MKGEEKLMSEENKIRKVIWARKDAVDAKMAEPGFEALAEDEQDAWVLGLMLGLPVEQAARCVRGEAEAGELAQLWEAIEEVFKFGKRSALRPLKAVLARHETLKKPGVWSAEAFGEGGYEVVSHEKEEEYRKRGEEENRSRRPEMYADECKPVWDGRN